MHCLGLNLWDERGHRCDFCVTPISGVESSGFVLWWLVAQWCSRSDHYWGFLLFCMDFMRSTVWFKIYNQPQKRFSPLILFISWIRLFLTVAYFVGFSVWQILPEEPEGNFFAFNFIRLCITAFWELVQCAFILTIRHGPQYQESAVSLLARVVALSVPGVIAHNPINYVNAVRLGPCLLLKGSKKTFSKLWEVSSLLYLLFWAMLFGTTYIINFQQVLKAQDNEPETSPENTNIR
jgi:hypothetical protein